MTTPLTIRIETENGEKVLWAGEEGGMEIGIPQSSPMWGEVGADRFLQPTPQEKDMSDFALDEETRKNRVNALARFYAADPPEEGYTSVEQLAPHAEGADLGSDVPLFRAVQSLAARVVQGGHTLVCGGNRYRGMEEGMDG